MKKSTMLELIGKQIEHKKFGTVEVIGVEDLASGKIICRVVETNDIKKLIFNRTFFVGVEKYEDVPFVKPIPKKQDRPRKEIDYDKYRNHPLVKAIDSKEFLHRIKVQEQEETEEVEEEVGY